MKLEFSQKSLLLLLGTIGLITIALYAQIATHDFVDWDDYLTIVENPAVTSFDIAAIFRGHTLNSVYAPITWLSFALQAKLCGFDAKWFHLTDLALHLGNVSLVFWLARKMLGGNGSLALFVALLFAVHPLHVESVAWATERKDTLSTLFLLLAFVSYDRLTNTTTRPKLWWTATTALFVMALLSKSSTVVFPLLALAWDYAKDGRITINRLRGKAFWFFLAVIAGIVNLSFQETPNIVFSEKFAFAAQLLNAPKALALYVFKSFFPQPLSAIYGEPYFTFGGLEWIVVAAALLAVAWAAWRGSAHKRRMLLCAGLFFLIPIAFVLRIIPFGDSQSLIHNRFMYFPSIGLFIMFAIVGADIFHFIHARVKNAAWLVPLLGLGGAAWFCYLTFVQIGTWKTSETLWSNVIRHYPNIAMPYNSLGTYRLSIGDASGAIPLLNQSIKLQENARARLDAQGNLAIALSIVGKHEQAAAVLQQLHQVLPKEAAFLVNLGTEYFLMKRFADARQATEKALTIDPKLAKAHYNLGLVSEAEGKNDEAIEHFLASLKIDPTFTQARERAAAILRRKNGRP